MRSSLVALSLACALVVSACGGGSSDPDPAATGAAAGEAAADDAAADGPAVPDDLCSLVSAEALSEALGVSVTTSAGPVDTCEFDAEDPRDVSGSYGVVPAADNGGYDTYVSGLTSVMEDPEVTEVVGVGSAATVAFGSLAGGYGTQGAGAADLGSVVVTSNVIGGDTAKLADHAEAVLRLAVAAVE